MLRWPPHRSKSHWLATLAVLAFAVRGAIPAGVMLAPGPDGRPVLEWCGGIAVPLVAISAESPVHGTSTDGHHVRTLTSPDATQHHSGRRVLCPFAATSSPGPMSALFVPAASPQRADPPAVETSTGIVAKSILRAQAPRGPPPPA